MPIMKDYTAKRYSHLTFLHKVPSRVGYRGARWIVACDCGNTREVEARQVTAGRVHTCGFCQLGRDLARRTGQRFGRLRRLERKLYADAFKIADKQGVVFNVNPPTFVELINKPCGYCLTPAGQTLQRLRLVCKEGIYTPENVIPACPVCVTMRGNLNHQEFLDLMAIIVNNHPRQ